ncbi:MAG: dTDP-4-dehydrorhamnose reductase [Rubrobacteraceae bacterium]|nr:dTDP-4-dehydrorhamnose reductase [Rubrobacter sp.]
MKVLLAGAGGQLGRELARLLPEQGHETVSLARADLDIADSRAVGRTIEQHTPDLVINAAAFTGVDAAETEAEAAYAVNALGPRNLAVACERAGCELLHVGTNYVFDGTGERPYEPFDPPNPLSGYGRTKLAGDEYVMRLCRRWYVVRTAGVYGEGGNFVRTMLRLAGERDEIRVKNDEFVSPTWARDLADGIIRIVEAGDYGLYHLTNSGSCSWYEFAREIMRLTGSEVRVTPISTSEFPLPAPRPPNGVLSGLGGPRLRPWRDALAEYLDREGEFRAGK